MKFETYYRLILTDKNGRVVKDTGYIPSHSYLIHYLRAIRGMAEGIYPVSTPDVNGVSRDIIEAGSADRQLQIDSGVGGDTWGIVVGTNDGSTPEDNENYCLDTKVLHSATGEAGKLNYRVVTFTIPAVSGPNVDFDISRPMINETAATITIKETGIICVNTWGNWYHLLLRDVVPDFDVDAGYTLTVVYRLRTTV